MSPAVQNSGSGAHTRESVARRKMSACSQNCRVGDRCRLQHALGRAGGARAELDEAGITGSDRIRPGLHHVDVRLTMLDQVTPGVCADRSAPLEIRQLGVSDQRGDIGPEVGVQQTALGEHPGNCGAAEEVPQLAGRGERRDRHCDSAGQGHTEDRGHGLGPVAHHDPNPGGVADPAADQPGGDACRFAQQIGVTPPADLAVAERIVEHQRLAVGVAGCDLGQESAEG